MAALDVITFHQGLEEQFGIEAVWFSEITSSAGVHMVAPDGSPIDIGFFNDSAKPGLPYPAPDAYALTTIPDTARHKDYRQILSQRAGETEAVLREEDSWDYLEGLDDVPYVPMRRRVGQPALGELIVEMARDAVVLDRNGGTELLEARRRLELPELRLVGQGLWRAGGLGKLDDAFFTNR
jgi:hypothetical protein